MKDKKGFTLVEILAVIVILGILVATIIGSVNGYVKKGKDAYNSDLDNQSIIISKNYFTDNQEDLSKGYITFKELASKGYLSKDFIDAYGNNCMENSYVTVKKIDNAKSLTLNNTKYYACIKCDDDGYENISKQENCNVEMNEETVPEQQPSVNYKTLTINVINGTVGGKSSNSYNIGNNSTYNVSEIKADEGHIYKKVECENEAYSSLSAGKLTVSNITKDTSCTVTFERQVTGTPIITLNVFNENDSKATLISNKNQETAKGSAASFQVKVPAPSDRYIISKEISCDSNGVSTVKQSDWKNEVNNEARTDNFIVTNNSVLDNTAISCTVTYKSRWVGVPIQTYTKGETITYGGSDWTVVSNKNDSVILALNSVASGSANLGYSSASSWLDSTWLNDKISGSLKTTLQTDRNNKGLLPLSNDIYFNTNSGISTNLTGYNYYVASNKFYNANERKHYKLTKTAFINESYKKNDKVTSTIYNTGYTIDYKTLKGIKSFDNNNKYYINSSNKLVFKNAGTPTSTSLNGYHTSRFMTFKIKKSISSSPCKECECKSTGKSGEERICYTRDKNYRTATVSSDGKKYSYVETALEDGYGYMGDGNKALFDTEKVKFYLCGGSYHGKLLTLSAKSTSNYTWTNPAGNTYNPSYDNNDIFRIAGNDSTYCPRTGKTSEYNGCIPKKTGVPHTRTYKPNENYSCKSNVKKYTLQNKEINLYYRPQLEVRKR